MGENMTREEAIKVLDERLEYANRSGVSVEFIAALETAVETLKKYDALLKDFTEMANAMDDEEQPYPCVLCYHQHGYGCAPSDHCFRWRGINEATEDDEDDPCWECTGYGDDTTVGENGELIHWCETCSNNPANRERGSE